MKISLITDRKIYSGDLIKRIKDLYKEKIIYQVIIREKDLNDNKLFDLYEKINSINGLDVLVNANINFIKKYNINRFHLSQKNLKMFKNKNLDHFYFGVSVHSINEAKKALKYKPNYLLVSNIFKTSCKPNKKAKGIKLLKDIREITDIKIVALGGINFENLKSLKNKNINYVAMRSALLR
ncbi:MAG: thiamine phosphate synthase [Bacillota bacterium]